jgi:2-oxoglutarate dehydrogenase E2 component (dihydrolipoamide succinyltransferase)
MPQLGETVVEGTVSRWLKAPGDAVAKFEPLLEISTDKIDTEVPAPADGTLLEILTPAGQTVRVGAALAYIGAAGEQPAHHEQHVQSTETATPVLDTQSARSDTPSSAEKPSGRAFVSPVVGRIAAEHHVDLDQVPGTGLNGRVTKKDLLAFVAQKTSAIEQEIGELEEIRGAEKGTVTNLASVSLRSQTSATTPLATTTPRSLASDEILHPLSAMRRAIGQHMVQSKQTSPHATTIFEVDMTAVVRHREAHKAGLAAKGIKLTFTPYFIMAVTAGLKAVPYVNGRFTTEGIVVNRRSHVGVAVALTDGLIVPVIRDADEKNLAGLARTVNELSSRARSGQLSPDEVQGGTFTITNHGVSGSLVGTPIINQPQAGILGIGAIVKRPVVRSANNSLLPDADDAIVIRPMCYLSLSFDHRILDGAEADRFLTVVKETLENWRE